METAVLDAIGTAPAPEAPPEDFAPLETAPEPAPVTAPAETPETNDEIAPEEERTYTAAEIEAARQEADKRVRGEWEKWRSDTEAKAKREAELAAYQQNQQLAENNRRGYAFSQLAQATKAAFEAGKDTPDPQAIAAVANNLARAAQHDGHTAIGGELWAAIQRAAPDYKPTAAIAQQAAEAARRYDYVGMAQAQFAMALEAGEQRAMAKAQAEAAAKAQQAAAQKVPAAPKRTASPTPVQGSGGGARTNRQILDTADPRSAEFRRAYEAEHGMPPP